MRILQRFSAPLLGFLLLLGLLTTGLRTAQADVWSPMNKGGEDGRSLSKIWFANASEGWAVGDESIVRHTTNGGMTWSEQTSPNLRILDAVWGVNTSNVWAVGVNGQINKYDGTSWTGQTSNTGSRLRAVWGTDANHVWAVGAGGTIVFYNGSTWTVQASGTTQQLNGIWGTDASNVWAVGAGGTIRKWNGTSWTTFASDTTTISFNGIWLTNSSNLWVVGSGGNIRKWDGTAWTDQTSGTTQSLTGIWGADANNIWAVGGSSVILKYDGSAWAPQTGATGLTLNGLWGVDANNVWAVSSSGIVQKWNGTAWIIQLQGSSAILTGVWGTSSNNVWTVGTVGTIRKYNGSSWTPQASGTTQQLNGVWGTDASNIWAVGDTGTILKYDGAAWSAQTSGTTLNLWAVWGADASNVWAVGGNADSNSNGTVSVILKYDGNAWSPQSSPVTQTIACLWGTGPNNVWAGGLSGNLLKYDGATWTPQTSSTTDNIYSIWGLDANNIWAVGGHPADFFGDPPAQGSILKYDGTSWTSQVMGQRQLYGVWGADSTHVWAVGDTDGAGSLSAILKWDGTSWTQDTHSTRFSRQAIWGSSASNAYVVGVNGIVETNTPANPLPIIDSATLQSAPTSAGPFTSTAPKTNDTLKVTVVSSDPENETLSYTYVWKVNGTTRKTTTASASATDTFDLSITGNGDKGQTVSVTVTVSDGTNTVNGPNNLSTVVVNTTPVVKPIELTTWAGRSLLSRPEVTDADSTDTFTFTYPSTAGTEGGTFTYSAAGDGLFLYNPPSTVTSATSEVSNFSVSDGTASVNSTITVQLAPAPGNVKRYAAVGASDVQGYGASDYDISKVTYSPALAYAPRLVQNEKLGSRYPGIVLSRRAVNGFTVFDALNRSVGGETMLTLTDTDGARAISLWYGPNDVLYRLVPLLINNLGTTPDGSGLNTVTSNWLSIWRPTYSDVVDSLQANDPAAKLVAVGTPDLGPSLSTLVAQRLGITNPTVIGRISTAITRAVTGTTATTGANGINAHIASLGLPYVDLVGDADITTNGQVDSSLQYQSSDLSEDGFHPKDSGYDKIATRLWRLCDPLLNHLPVANNSTKVATANTSTNGQLLGTDFESSALTFAKATDPAHGSVTVQSNGSYTYTPDANYEGNDSFTFTVNDGTDTSAPATITLIVREDIAPQVTLQSPTNNQKILTSAFSGDIISGTATDNNGVTAVRVRLSRKRNNVNEYWNGTDWVAIQFLLNATVNPVGGQNVTWTLNGQLPPVNKLDAGAYSVQVSAFDAAGNRSAYANGAFTLQTDVTAPTLTINTPPQSAKILIEDFNGSTISGTVSDDSGVVSVKVRLSRKRNNVNEYWNGTDFVTSSSYVDAQVTGTNWILGAQTPPAGKLDSGLYQVEAYAVDGANNKSATAKVTFTLGTDFVAPGVAISSPTPSQVVGINNLSAGFINGTASDNKGVVAVQLKLQRKRGTVTEYWNGTAFTTTAATVDATVTGTTSATWSYDNAIPASALDAGSYTLYATAFDAAGNKTTSPSRAFAIVGSPSATSSDASLAKSAGNS